MDRMSVDVDAVNERLHGLVTLLQAVGVDSLDTSDVAKSLGGNRQLNDDQIEAIIRKLQQAQAEAPQIIAALEAHAEARSLSGGAGSRVKQQPARHQVEEEEEEDEDDEDDEFDEDANYPMVGHGISDDISVVSDLTTPTVLTGVPVPEEEHYRDTLPPMMVGGGAAPPMMINPTKRKNLVNQVRPVAGGIAPPRRNVAAQPRVGGAAASRRKKYLETMDRLGEHGAPPTKPAPASSASARKPAKASSSSSIGNNSAVGKPKRSAKQPKEANNFSELASSRANEWANGDSSGWNAFESRPRSLSKAPTVIDDDGFLVGESFDPFASTASNPFKSTAGDLEFGSSHRIRDPFSSNQSADGFEAFGPSSNPRRKKKPSSGAPVQSAFSSSSGRKEGAPKPLAGPAPGARPRRARRASLAT